MRKLFYYGLIIIVVISVILIATVAFGLLIKGKLDARQRCFQNQVDEQGNDVEMCANYACNELNLSWAHSNSWAETTVNCISEKGAVIEVDYSSIKIDECRRQVESTIKLNECLRKI